MTESIDALLQRRALRKKLMRWRFVAVLGFALLVAVLGMTQVPSSSPYVAYVDIRSIILQDRERSAILRDLAHDDDVLAVIVTLDSPGGTAYGGEQLLSDLTVLRGQKPVVAVMETMATSAAYMTAVGADYIVAGETTITGSVGVILQAAEITGLLEKIGVTPVVIKSGTKKAIPNMFEPIDDAGRAQVESSILETFYWFRDLVAERRGLSEDIVAQIADGRIVTGRNALNMGLVDAIGGELQARAWLEQEHSVSAEADSVVVWPLPVERTVFETVVGDPIGQALHQFLGKSQVAETLMLDGLLALWQPVQ